MTASGFGWNSRPNHPNPLHHDALFCRIMCCVNDLWMAFCISTSPWCVRGRASFDFVVGEDVDVDVDVDVVVCVFVFTFAFAFAFAFSF